MQLADWKARHKAECKQASEAGAAAADGADTGSSLHNSTAAATTGRGNRDSNSSSTGRRSFLLELGKTQVRDRHITITFQDIP